MDKRLREVLEGGIGYFWLCDDDAISELDDEAARAGFIRRRVDTVEVDVLHDDPAHLLMTDDPLPRALVGVTEHTGVIVPELRGRTRNMRSGAGRASAETLRSQTLVVDPDVVGAKSSLFTSVSAYFQGNGLLPGAGFDVIETDVRVDANNRAQSATIHLKPTTDVVRRLSASLDLCFTAGWSFQESDDLRQVVDTALEIEVRSARPLAFSGLLQPLLRCQEFLCLAFGGFVGAEGGRAGRDDDAERAHVWNATLMPTALASHVPVLANKEPALFRLDDLGGLDVFGRWIRLCKKHPRAVSPIVNVFRRGAASDDVRLLELAAAMEYWVARHRRSSSWTSAGDNHAEAIALHVGAPFHRWTGDSARWAERFWFNYTQLKHDPSFVPDGMEIKVLQEVAYLLLVAELMNRIAKSKRPGATIFGEHSRWQLRDWTRRCARVWRALGRRECPRSYRCGAALEESRRTATGQRR